MPGLPLNLDDLIFARAVEDARREFKASWNEPDKKSVVRTVSAFANDLLNLNGGYVILGIETDENGEPILPPRGLKGANLDKLQKEIQGECKKISPEYQPVVFIEEFQGQRIAVIWAPGGDNRPYQAPRRDGTGRTYHVRLGSQSVEARDDILRQLLERTAKIPFDDRRNQSARLEDLSAVLVRRFLADVRSDLARSGHQYDDPELYRLLKLTTRINAHEVPRNFALLFFNEEPDNFFPGTRVEIVQFADGAGGDLLEERAVRGPLPQQIQLSLDYLSGMADVLIRKVPGQAQVDRTVAYPYEAMEEALVNALYHRSYESPDPVKIYLYPDRMEIFSYPGPVAGITKEMLTGEQSLPSVPARNRRVGDLLKELRLAESRGTGLPKIRREMKENGSPAPEFEFDDSRTYFRVTLPAHPRYMVLHSLRESARMWALGERLSALANLQSAFDKQPGSGALAGQLIEFGIASNDFKLAQRTFDRFHQEADRTEVRQPYLRYAGLLLDRGKLDQAENILSIVPTGGSSEELENLAALQSRMRDYKEEKQMATPASGLRPRSIQINLFSGARKPLPPATEVLLTVRNGNQDEVRLPNNGFFNQPTVNIVDLPFFDNFGDNYTVVASASGYQQAGFTPVKVSQHGAAIVDIMLLKKDPAYNFRDARWDALQSNFAEFASILAADAADGPTAKDRYTQLLETKPDVLACFLNLATAMSQINLPDGTPIDYIRELIWDDATQGMKQDRFFAWADRKLIDQVVRSAAQGKFAPEPGTAAFHPGATRSWKQVQFGEANVQLTFHEGQTRTIDGVDCVVVEPDIDYFRDPVAHTVIEVFVNSLTHSLTDPRQVYVLRWIAGRQAGIPNFEPPYFLE